jgi:hypothetical protein
MTDAPIALIHDWLWFLISALRGLFDIAPYIMVFTLLSLVFTGLVIAINRQHEELEQKDEEKKNSQ